MRIICPECQTSFHASEEICNEYDGFVRCGECHAKFNISGDGKYLDLQADTQEDQIQMNEKDSSVELDDSNAPYLRGGLLGDVSSDDVSLTSQENNLFDRGDDNENFPDDFSKDLLKEDTSFTSDNVTIPEESDTIYGEISKQEKHVEKEHLVKTDQSNWQEGDDPQLPEYDFEEDISYAVDSNDSLSLNSSDLPAFESDADIDFSTPVFQEPAFSSNINLNASQDDLNQESESHWHNDYPIMHIKSKAGRWIIFILWLILAVLLMALLVYQWSNLKQNSAGSSISTSMSTMACRIFSCANNDKNIEYLDISISRMDEITDPERQLHITLFVQNNAQIAQPYPNVLITLKQFTGEISGRRVISPNEYFTEFDSLVNANNNAIQASDLRIQPGKLGKIVIMFDHPPEKAVGFSAKIVSADNA